MDEPTKITLAEGESVRLTWRPTGFGDAVMFNENVSEARLKVYQIPEMSRTSLGRPLRPLRAQWFSLDLVDTLSCGSRNEPCGAAKSCASQGGS